MSILDDAIREHLALKRAHGADDAELKKLEDEAFGPPARPDEPDPFAEAPTEFMAAPDEEGERGAGDQGERRVPNVADLQEAPPAPAEESAADEPAAKEHEIPAESGPSTEERQAIADQPTEMFDVEGTYQDAEGEGPSDEELVDAELSEPPIAPVDPLAGIEGGGPEGAEAEDLEAESAAPEIADEGQEPKAESEEDEPEDEFDEFFSEQRLSDELNQALEAPLPDEPGAEDLEEGPNLEDAPEADDEEHEYEEEDSAEHEVADEPRGDRETSESDLLERTPDFLEDAPEDDDLWFEQKPPKDFDFDD
jgi:hypothetical protein